MTFIILIGIAYLYGIYLLVQDFYWVDENGFSISKESKKHFDRQNKLYH